MKKVNISIICCFLILFVSAQNENICLSGNCVNGTGELKYASGEVYSGNFKNSKPNGEGILKESHVDSIILLPNSMESKKATTSTIQKGSWKNGELNGEGYMLMKSQKFIERKEALPDSSNGLKYVWNIYSVENYVEINGHFSNGIVEGYAVTESYTTKQDDPKSKVGNRKYEGNFKNSDRNGKGKLYKWINGSYQLTNEGEFLNGKFIKPLK
ncbi:MAG: hypothetical protein Q8K64_15700 [Sediminibacterium sp.]|nr:hypothetical protein [Sediminibacterium sp.]TXT32883.1 MAG: MORN repeat protein [Chitinophagaceae bacterium]